MKYVQIQRVVKEVELAAERNAHTQVTLPALSLSKKEITYDWFRIRGRSYFIFRQQTSQEVE